MWGRLVRCTAATAALWPARPWLTPRSLGCRRLPFPSGQLLVSADPKVVATAAGSGIGAVSMAPARCSASSGAIFWDASLAGIVLPFHGETKGLFRVLCGAVRSQWCRLTGWPPWGWFMECAAIQCSPWLLCRRRCRRCGVQRWRTFSGAELGMPPKRISGSGYARKGTARRQGLNRHGFLLRLKHGGAGEPRAGRLLKNQCSHAHYPRQTQGRL